MQLKVSFKNWKERKKERMWHKVSLKHSTSQTGCLTLSRKQTFTNYLLIIVMGMRRIHTFRRELHWSEMQTASFRIWTWNVYPISDDDNRYGKRIFINYCNY